MADPVIQDGTEFCIRWTNRLHFEDLLLFIDRTSRSSTSSLNRHIYIDQEKFWYGWPLSFILSRMLTYNKMWATFNIASLSDDILVKPEWSLGSISNLVAHRVPLCFPARGCGSEPRRVHGFPHRRPVQEGSLCLAFACLYLVLQFGLRIFHFVSLSLSLCVSLSLAFRSARLSIWNGTYDP